MSNLRGRQIIEKYKKVINILISLAKIFPKRVRKYWFNFFQNTKGKKGLLIRYILFKSISEASGENISIHPNVYIFNLDRFVVGDNVSIHPFCYIQASGGITIGNDVSIAHGVTLMTENHIFSDLNEPINNQGTEKKEIVIRNDVWIGAKATILYGTIIERGTIIGANAVVTKSTADYAVYAGVPAVMIKER